MTDERRGSRATALRGYSTDSAAAAARIVALAMIADGRLSPEEFEVVTQVDCDKLGIARTHLRDALNDLCEDLLGQALQRGSDACCVEPDAIRRLTDEIDDRGLRIELTALCLRIAAADRCVSRGEAQFLLQVFEHWNADDEEVASALFGNGSVPQRLLV